MKKLFIAVLIILPLFGGFFPSAVNSAIGAVSGNNAKLTTPFPVNGMSGIVMHHFGNDTWAISSIAVQISNSNVKLLKEDILGAPKMPQPKILATVGDRVIGGYLYNNILVLAPNAQTYNKIVSSASKHWIHPDIYASFLSKEGDSTPTLNNLRKFAKEAQVGLIYIVQRDRAVLLDPISGVYINSMPFTPIGNDIKYPFYMRFKHFRRGLFGGGSGNYYKDMESIK